MKTIKVLAINTSPRKGRNTEQLLNEVIAGCRSINEEASTSDGVEKASVINDVRVETELIQVADAPDGQFNMCRGCWACKKGTCVCGDDYVKLILDKIREADAVVFGVPVYFYGVTAQCKTIMDRSLAYMPIGENKIAATAITCGSAGVASTLQAMQAYYSAQDLLDAGWVATYGKTSDKIVGKEVAFGLGRKIVRLAEMLKSSEENARAAAEAGDERGRKILEDLAHTNHFAYGTHTF